MYSVYYFSVTCADLHNFESSVFLLRSSLSKTQATKYLKVCNNIASCYYDDIKDENVRYPHYFMTEDKFETFKYFKVDDFSRVGPLPEFTIKRFKKAVLDEKHYVDDDIKPFVNIDKEYGFVILDSMIDKYSLYIKIIQNMENWDLILKNALVKCFSSEVFGIVENTL